MREADYVYHNYRLFVVYQRSTPEVRREIIRLWQRHNVVRDQREADLRSHQAVIIIRNEQNDLIGLSTIYTGEFLQRGNLYYFYRMFIQPEDRIPGMMWEVTTRTFEVLQAHPVPGKPPGIIIVTENPKLMRPGMKRSFERHGWTYLGRGPRNNDLWSKLF